MRLAVVVPEVVSVVVEAEETVVVGVVVVVCVIVVSEVVIVVVVVPVLEAVLQPGSLRKSRSSNAEVTLPVTHAPLFHPQPVAALQWSTQELNSLQRSAVPDARLNIAIPRRVGHAAMTVTEEIGVLVFIFSSSAGSYQNSRCQNSRTPNYCLNVGVCSNRVMHGLINMPTATKDTDEIMARSSSGGGRE